MNAPDGETHFFREGLNQHFKTLLAVTILAGAALRFLFPGDVSFAADEAFALVLGGDWLHSPRVALHGMPASIGVDNPPASVYFFAALYAVSGGDPFRATLAVIAWNVLGLVLAGLYVGRRRSGRFWAWWALALLCFHPWGILLSRKIWAQDLLFPLVVVAWWGLEAIWSRWSWRRIGAGATCALLVSQIHLSGMAWLAALAPFCAVFWPKEQKRRLPLFLLLCAGIFVILYAPWLMHLFRTGLGERIPAEESAFLKHAVFAFGQFGGVWTGWGGSLDFFFGAEELPFRETMGLFWATGQYLLLLLVGVAAAGALAELFRALCGRFGCGGFRQDQDAEPPAQQGEDAPCRARRQTLALQSGTLFLFPLLFAGLGISIHPHYGAVLIFPAAMVLAGGFEAVERRWKRGSGPRRLLRSAACLVLALHVWSALGFFGRIHAAGGTRGDYGATLAFKTREIARMYQEGQKELSDTAPLEYHYLADRWKGRRTRLEDHPRPY